MTRDEALKAAVALDRLGSSRYGERLAEVLVGGHSIDLRKLDRRPQRRTGGR